MSDNSSKELQKRLGQVFKRVFRRDLGDGLFKAKEMEEWDSLSHVNLVIELEIEFGLEIEPDDIARLYSDTGVILEYLRENTEG